MTSLTRDTMPQYFDAETKQIKAIEETNNAIDKAFKGKIPYSKYVLVSRNKKNIDDIKKEFITW
jgi:hypothetical protein